MSAPVVVEGPVYVVRGNVDTDTLIKSRHCTTTDPARLAPHCLAELDHPVPFAGGGPFPIVVCAGTFGVGSARIQAPLALAGAGVRAVLATAFAPIFFENCINGALLLPLCATVDPLPDTGAAARLQVAGERIVLSVDDREQTWPCRLPDWALAGRSWMSLIEDAARAAGGLDALREEGFRG